MDINQDINRQKTTIDLSQLPSQERPQGNRLTPSKKAGSEIPPAILTASTVSLSPEGRAASVAFDFNATAHNIARLNTLSPESFAKAHASISYENVKNLLD